MATENKKKRKKKKELSFNGRVFLVVGMIAAVVFLPTTLMLLFGLAPSFVVAMVDRTKKKLKAFTVGAMNVAGCSPFLFELWTEGNNFAKSFEIIFDPQAIIIIYAAALVGYLVEWICTAMVSGFLYQKGLARRKAILKRQSDLKERWGASVAGNVPLDEDGFPVEENPENPKE